MTTPDPVRWLDAVDGDAQAGPLSADERAALHSIARLGPSTTQHARMWSALQGAGGAAPARLGPRRLPWWWASTLLVAAGALWWTLAPRAPARVPPSAPAPVLTPTAPAAAAATAPNVEPTTAPTPARTPPEPTSPRVAPASPKPRRPGVAAPSAAPPELATPGAELTLLTPARQLLATDPARSLALADEHAQRFPHGVFAEERAFLRIEALLRLGKSAPASVEAERFRRSYPRSTYLERLSELERQRR